MYKVHYINSMQTLSILIQNVKNQQTIYYLFSNDHINKIVMLRFDFNDDELLGYYVNLLKTISLRLNESTVQFFFHSTSSILPQNNGSKYPHNTRDNSPAPLGDITMDKLSLQHHENTAALAPSSAGDHQVFPLYTEAIKFISHKDGMVRAAVKTLTLNVFAIQLPSLQSFLCQPACLRLFEDVAQYTAEKCLQLNRLLSSWELPPSQAVAAVEACLAEIEDALAYCNDVTMSGVHELSTMLLDELWKHVVGPVIYWPLIVTCSPRDRNLSPESTLDISTSTNNDTASIPVVDMTNCKGCVGPLCSLFVLERFLYASTDTAMVALLATAVLGSRQGIEESADILMESLEKKEGNPKENSTSQTQQHSMLPPYNTMLTKRKILHGIGFYHTSIPCRDAMICTLCGTHDAHMVSASLRVVATILGHGCVSEQCLDSIGLLSLKKRKQLQLIADLLPQESDVDKHLHSVVGEEEMKHGNESARIAVHDNRYGDSLHPITTSTVQAATNESTHQGSLYFDEIVDAILDGIALDTLAPGSIEIAGWILYQLIPSPTVAAVDRHTGHGDAYHPDSDALPAIKATPSHSQSTLSSKSAQHTNTMDCGGGGGGAHQRLKSILHQSITSTHSILQYSWTDAVLPVALFIWPRSRSSMLHRTGSGPVYVAAQTWIQGALLQELQWNAGAKNSSSEIHANSMTGTRTQTHEEVKACRENIALAAQVTCRAVRRFVTLLQVEMILRQGTVPEQPPFMVTGAIDVGVISSAGSSRLLQEIAKHELHEEHVISYSNAGELPATSDTTTAMWECSVAFRQGQEQRVLLKTHHTHFTLDSNDGDGDAIELLQSPVAILVEYPKQQSLSRAHSQLSSPKHQQAEQHHDASIPVRVLSSAPLFALDAQVDQHHPEWLHIRVRPPVSSLLRVLSLGLPSGIELAAIQKHIASGHWVLAFAGKDGAREACSALIACAETTQARYGVQLSKLLLVS